MTFQDYKGSATNTNTLSSDWAADVSVIWTVPEPHTDIDEPSETTLFVGDTTLYIVSRDLHSHSVSLAATDISSSELAVLQTFNDGSIQVPYLGIGFSIVPVGEQPAVESILILKVTGIQTQAPWEDGHPIIMVDDILVICSGMETCVGWEQEFSSWTRQWWSVTGKQSHSPSLSRWDGPCTVGTGEETSTLVPVDNYRNPQIVNVYAGVVTPFGQGGRLANVRSYSRNALYPASDGLIVCKNAVSLEKFDMSDNSLGTLGPSLKYIIPTEDGRMPTLNEWDAFFGPGETPWTAGMLEATGDRCQIFTTYTSGDVAEYSAEGLVEVSSSTRPPCSFSPTYTRASAGGTAAFILDIGYKEQAVCFSDMANNKTHTSTELRATRDHAWVFDDLLVGLTDEGLVAFTPTSSQRYPGSMTDLPFRIGQAIDVHAFAAPGSPRPPMVACLEWPGKRSFERHSDAGVVAHALCDATLLAVGLGELDTVFGMDHSEQAGAPGHALLEEVRRMTAEASWMLGNMTVQVMGNRPRMVTRLPGTCAVMSGVAGDTVTVSATTSDHLGFTGRGEGVVALANALMVRTEQCPHSGPHGTDDAGACVSLRRAGLDSHASGTCLVRGEVFSPPCGPGSCGLSSRGS